MSLRHSPAITRPTTRVQKPSMMPVTILQVSTIKTAQTRPASASTRSSICRRLTLDSISRPTYISAGAVAYDGTRAASGEKNITATNSRPTTTAVRPVLAPAATPTVDSI
ncbi:hypothetical protein D3C72_1957550 [compost metagenome]